MNKKAQIFDDINLGAWAILSGVGLVVLLIMFTAWSRMDFQISTVTKIILFVMVIPVAYIFTRVMFD